MKNFKIKILHINQWILANPKKALLIYFTCLGILGILMLIISVLTNFIFLLYVFFLIGIAISLAFSFLILANYLIHK